MINKNIENIHKRMLLKLNEKFDKSVGSWSYDILKPVAIELDETESKIMLLDSKRDIDNLVGDELDKYIAQKSPIERNKATKSTGTVNITGKVGTIIEVGTIVASISNQYVTVYEEKIGEDGIATVLVESVNAGDSSVANKGEVNTFPVTVNGLETVINNEPITGGYDEESDDSLRERYLIYRRLPITSGNVYHYETWAKSISGVGSVRVNPLWNGEGTVEVVITDSNQEVATEELKKEVYDYIETKRPVGAKVTVNSAEPYDIKVEAVIKKSSNYDMGIIEGEFEQLLEKYRQDIAFEGYYVSHAKVGSLLLSVNGVLDYEELSLNGESANVHFKLNEIPVFNEVKLKEWEDE